MMSFIVSLCGACILFLFSVCCIGIVDIKYRSRFGVSIYEVDGRVRGTLHTGVDFAGPFYVRTGSAADNRKV